MEFGSIQNGELSSYPVECFAFKYGYWGNNIADSVLASSLKECRQQCEQTEGCWYFTFYGENLCQLKGIAAPTSGGGWDSYHSGSICCGMLNFGEGKRVLYSSEKLSCRSNF